MRLFIDRSGSIKYLYTEAIDADNFGTIEEITRASNVEPVGQLWESQIIDGPILGPYKLRSQALAAEINYLETEVLCHG